MPNIIIFDIDRGLKSIGNDDRIEEVFGYRPRRFIRSEKISELFDKLHTPNVIQTEDILGIVEEEVYEIANGHEIDFEILDSITAHQAQKKKELKGNAARVTLPQWGELGEAIEDLILKLCRTNTNVIIIGHTKAQEDNDLGVISYIPALSGRMKDEIARYFDIVMYTVVSTDKNTGHREYLWQVIADERRAAKCRLDEVTKWAAKSRGLIPQDYELLFNKIKQGGYKAVKILVLGDSGTGKTYSLRTLKNVEVK